MTGEEDLKLCKFRALTAVSDLLIRHTTYDIKVEILIVNRLAGFGNRSYSSETGCSNALNEVGCSNYRGKGIKGYG